MNSFFLKIVPEIPTANHLFADLDFNLLDKSRLLKRDDKIDISFVISGKEFGYYPSNALVAIDDLYSELDKLRLGEEHYITLSGYQILFAGRERDSVVLYDLDSASGSEPNGAVVGSVHATEIEDQLVKAASALIEFTDAFAQAPPQG